MNILVVGSSGREHAIASTLKRNDNVTLFSVMGKKNPGIADLSADLLINPETDSKTILAFCKKNEIKYAFIGPEAPLGAGLVDVLTDNGIICTGPCKNAAQIETDKAFCRELMKRHNIKGLPEYHIFSNGNEAADFILANSHNYALKPVGLTGGKGVRIMGEHLDKESACEYVKKLTGGIVIEECLIGEEFTLMAFSDGVHLVPMPLVQDHKRAFEGDVGPNTGGMGSYTMPDHFLPFVSTDDYNRAFSIMQQTIDALRNEGMPFSGILYGQFMNTVNGPVVIEFNARFGDPEAMNVLSLLETDLFEIMKAISLGKLDNIKIEFKKIATVCKYLVPEGYPDNPQTGKTLPVPSSLPNTRLYYASVVKDGDKLITQSSRTMAYVGLGKTLEEAEKNAEEACKRVSGAVRYRKDIGTQAVLNKRINHMQGIRNK